MHTNTDSSRTTNNSVTMSIKLTKVKTPPLEDPGAFYNNQAKLSQPIKAHKIMLPKLSEADSDADKNNSAPSWRMQRWAQPLRSSQ